MTLTLNVEYISTNDLVPNPRNARTHSKKQIVSLAEVISTFGFTSPILADEHKVLIAGHGRLAAARMLGLAEVPVISLPGLSEAQKRTLMLADNKLASRAGWDRERLAIEIGELIAIDEIPITLTGFEIPEIDQILLDGEESPADPADEAPAPWAATVARRGDLFVLGKHRILCGDAREQADVQRLMADEHADMVFTDPPYNVKISNIVGRGDIEHPEFAMASGEMGEVEFRQFLSVTLSNAVSVSRDGAVHYAAMDWRQIEDLIAVGKGIYGAMLNLAVWVKGNGGQGSFYRSQHELIGIFRVGDKPNLNNIELGRHGRNRTNVWEFAGINSFGKGRLDDLAAHPTVKPVAMIVEAIKDCTKRGDIVLDVFAGSGTTMLAAERLGRRCRSLEYEPRYVDVAIRRWQAFTGKDAIHAETGSTFDEMAIAAASEGNPEEEAA